MKISRITGCTGTVPRWLVCRASCIRVDVKGEHWERGQKDPMTSTNSTTCRTNGLP